MAKKSIDIRLFARGGEGIKTASKILASAVIESGGKYAQEALDSLTQDIKNAKKEHGIK